MGSRRQVIHFCCSCCSTLSTFLHQSINFIWRSNCPFRESFNENSSFLIFSNLERSPLNFQEIWDDFVINLQIWNSDHESCILWALHLDKFENFLHRPGYYTSLRVTYIIFETFHRMSLTGTSLTISQDSCIISLQNWYYWLLSSIFINKFLRRVIVINIIKREILPHAQMRIDIHISLPFLLSDFCP